MKKLFFYFSILAFGSIIVAANRVSFPYSTYQIMMWEIKANESFSPTWYPDGKFWVKTSNGTKVKKQAYTIAYGFNNWATESRTNIAKKYMKNGKFPFQKATELIHHDLNKFGKLNSDPYRDIAMKLHAFNTGQVPKNLKELKNCCNGLNSCGSPNSRIRNHHNERRSFEVALWTHDFHKIQERTEKNKKVVEQHLIMYSNR